MSVPSEPFAAVYKDRNRLGVIVARTGRGGFEAYAPGEHCLGLFPTPREAAAAIFMAHPWVARMMAEYKPKLSICKAAEPRRFDDPLLVSEQMPA